MAWLRRRGVRSEVAATNPSPSASTAADPSPRPSVWEDAQSPSVSTWMSANAQAGRGYTFDWCRFRRNSHCYFTGLVDADASSQMNYAVYVPMDRGYCWRSAWEVQRKCGSGQPGPNVNDSFSTLLGGSELAYTDATVPWEAMGQRLGEKAKDYAPPAQSANTPWIEGQAQPRELAEDERVTLTPDATGLTTGATLSPVGSVSERTRALGELVQLRTAGYLSFFEFKVLRARIDRGRSVLTTEVPLGSLDATTPPAVRLAQLEASAVIGEAEGNYLRQRLAAGSGGPRPAPFASTEAEYLPPVPAEGNAAQSPPRESGPNPSPAVQGSDDGEPVNEEPLGSDEVSDIVQAIQPQIHEVARLIAASLFRSSENQETLAPRSGPTPSPPSTSDTGLDLHAHAGPHLSTGKGLAEQLEALAALHISGSLTDAEFAAAKLQLLGD